MTDDPLWSVDPIGTIAKELHSLSYNLERLVEAVRDIKTTLPHRPKIVTQTRADGVKYLQCDTLTGTYIAPLGSSPPDVSPIAWVRKGENWL